MLSTKYKNGLIGTVFGKVNFSAGGTFYFGVSTTPINADGSGMTEPDPSSGYARIPIPNNAANWNAASNGMISNKLDIKMNEIIVDSGTATDYFLSESINGNAEIWETFSEPRPMPSHSTLTIVAGQAQFSIIDAASK